MWLFVLEPQMNIRDVFIDGHHGAYRYFLCFLIITHLESSFFSFLFVVPSFGHFQFFCFNFLFPIYPFFKSIFSPSFTRFCSFSSPSLQSAGPAWTTPHSFPLDPPWSPVAVKVLVAVLAAEASWEGAWDTIAATLHSPTPSTTWPSCRHPTNWPWNLRSAATARWKSWVSHAGDNGMGGGEKMREILFHIKIDMHALT